MNIIIMIVMGLLGILFYTLFKAREYVTTKTFNPKVFFPDNLGIWLWAVCVLIATACALFLEPQANAFIKTFIGFDLVNTKTGWLVFGGALCSLVSDVKK